ncbi:hypothetical protein [Morganella morganii]|uniref:hypothetical protein n=1 Tax=Morganella morganii TaxID=582 RepID=UPI0030FECE53
MQKFNRELQKHILTVCIAAYPKCPSWSNYDPDKFPEILNDNILLANMYYLSERGLITIEIPRNDDPFKLFENICATADGIDFMMKDGGLKAILDIRTIKVHSDTMKQLEEIISMLNIPEAERKGLLAKLRELPSSTITHLTNELTLKAVLALPGALPIIQTYLQNL